jgi:hypothetical protein
MSSLKIVVLTVCALAIVFGFLAHRPAWILGGVGGVLAALLMPLEMPS